MQKKILFVHGMFQNSRSWDRWAGFFSEHGFACSAPDWPCHAGEPAELRENIPPGLGQLTLEEVVDSIAAECDQTGDLPIVIGHSVGGLIAQILAARNLASAAICISSVAPNDLIAADWHLLKNVAAITNPLKGHEPYIITPEAFHASFCNTMSVEESNEAYVATATHDSRQVLRDCLGRMGHINLSDPHVPLLFVSGDSDHIIPSILNRRNCEHYKDPNCITEHVEFPNRGHFICGDPNWEQVAAFTHDWLLARMAELAPVEARA